MPYPPQLVEPLREEARRIGFEELMTAETVNHNLDGKAGTTLILVNSVCGCAANGARPGLALALQDGPKPDKMITVFAGQDVEATASVREHFAPYQPSSPQIALLKDGELVFMLQRHDIEARPAEAISGDIKIALAEHCA